MKTGAACEEAFHLGRIRLKMNLHVWDAKAFREMDQGISRRLGIALSE